MLITSTFVDFVSVSKTIFIRICIALLKHNQLFKCYNKHSSMCVLCTYVMHVSCANSYEHGVVSTYQYPHNVVWDHFN